MPPYLLFPLAAAITYSLSSIFIKKALVNGAPTEGSFHLSNFILGAFFLPLLFMGSGEIEWSRWIQPVVTGVFFFAGMRLTFLSIQRGDVSLVTPLMGTKVVFVALAVVVLTSSSPSGILWVAAILTAVGIFVMGVRDMHAGPKVFFTVGITLSSAALFGISDVLVQKWAPGFGQLPFLSLMALTVTAGSMVMWVGRGRGQLIQLATRRTILVGAFFNSLQAILVGIGLAFFDDATGVNVVYASRGLWAVVLVYFLGRQLGNRERETAGGAFVWRFAGTALLTAAIVLAVWDGSHR